jgi:YbbR domain-containing protein
MKHLGLKITAFIFAIALWLYVMSLNTFQITVDVPLRLAKLPEMLAVASKPPQTISVTLEGEAFNLMRMRTRMNL